MPEQQPAPDNPEVKIQPVEVQFGDVVEILRHGQPEKPCVVVDAAQDQLQASTILKEPDGTEYLSAAGTVVLPVRVVAKWDFDKVFEATMHYWENGGHRTSPELRDKIRKILEQGRAKPPVTYTGQEVDY